MNMQVSPPQMDPMAQANAQAQSKLMVDNALKTGLKMLNAEDIATPNAWNKDLAGLESILISILQGQLVLTPAAQSTPEQPPKAEEPPLKPYVAPPEEVRPGEEEAA